MRVQVRRTIPVCAAVLRAAESAARTNV